MSTLEKAVCRPAVFPWFAEKEQWPPDTLNLVYQRLVSEDILADLCHDRHVTEEEFVKFVGDALSYLLVDQATNQIAGIGWFDDIEESDCVKKARSAIAFFKNYWHPKVTEQFGLLLLSHAFGVLEIDVVYGMTPASNILVQKFCKRVGFEYVARIPNFCSRRGELADALVCTMDVNRFNQIIADRMPEQTTEGG